MEYFPGRQGALGFITIIAQTRHDGVCLPFVTCTPSVWEVQMGALGGQGHPQQCSEVKVILGGMRPCLRNKRGELFNVLIKTKVTI